MKAIQLVKLLVYNEILRKETFSDFDFLISVNQTAIYLHDIVLKYNCHSMHKNIIVCITNNSPTCSKLNYTERQKKTYHFFRAAPTKSTLSKLIIFAHK